MLQLCLCNKNSKELAGYGRVEHMEIYKKLTRIYVFYFLELTQGKTEKQLKYSSIKTTSNLQWKQASKTLKEISENSAANSDLIRKDCIPALWGRGQQCPLSPFLCSHVLEVLGFTTN